MLAQLEVKEINSRTFKDFYWFSRTFQSWNFVFPIQGLSRIFKARGYSDKICLMVIADSMQIVFLELSRVCKVILKSLHLLQWSSSL
jgi:hypothetical protein